MKAARRFSAAAVLAATVVIMMLLLSSLHHASATSLAPLESTIWLEKPVRVGDIGINTDVSTTAIDSPAANADSPRIAVSGNMVYVAWTITNYNWSQIYFARSSDGGSSFETADNISRSGDMQSMYQQLAAFGDNVYLVWNDVEGYYNINHISFAASDDRGSTFHVVRNMSNNTRPYSSYEPQVATAADGGTVYVTWRNEDPRDGGIIFGKSNNGGSTFRFTNLGDGFHPKLAATAAGGSNVYVSWLVQAIREGVMLNNVQFARSHDGGSSFSRPLMLSNNTWGIHVYDQIPIPVMVADGGNDVFVAWRYTTNNSTAGGNHANFLTASYDGGTSFTKPVAIKGGGTDTIDAPILASSSSATHGVFILWQESNSESFDTLLVRGTIPEAYVQAGNQGGQGTLGKEPLAWQYDYPLFAIMAAAGGGIAAVAYIAKRRRTAR